MWRLLFLFLITVAFTSGLKKNVDKEVPAIVPEIIKEDHPVTEVKVNNKIDESEEEEKNDEHKGKNLVFCYLNREAAYRPSLGIFDIEDIQPDLCTHLIYAFGKIDADTNHLVSADPLMDLSEEGHDGFGKITSLKETNPHLKVLLAVGGWKNNSIQFSNLAADPAARSAFAKQSAEFLAEHDFDGIDINWHFPCTRGGKVDDKANLVKLVIDLKQEYKKHGFLVTIPIEASKDIIDSGYDVENLSKHADFIFVMAYDMGGSWDRRVSANAPLDVEGSAKSVKFTVDYMIFRKAIVEKLVLGLPFYGRTFISELDGLLGDAANLEGFKGPYTDKNGYLGYNEICDAIKHPSFNWTSEWVEDISEMISKYREPQTNMTHAVVYDTQRSLANKVRFAVRRKLAGVMVWSIDTGDFRGTCREDEKMYEDFGKFPEIELELPKPPKGKYSLLKAIKQAFGVSELELEKENGVRERKEEERSRNWIKKSVVIPKIKSGATSSSLFATFVLLPAALVHFLTI